MGRTVAAVAAACVLGLALVVAASAEVGDVPDAETWVTDGPVYSIARSGDRTFLGGDFSYVGPRTGSGVQLAPVGASNAGDLDPSLGSFPEVSGGRVLAAVGADDGSWYIGGDFTDVGGVSRSGLARLVPSSGELVVDAGFSPRPAGSIHALALGAVQGKDDHVLYVGGSFELAAAHFDYRNLAALDRLDGQPVSAMASPGGVVRSIDVLRQDEIETTLPLVFVAGDFTDVGGTARNQVAAIWGVGAEGELAGTLTGFAPSPARTGVRVLHVGRAVKNTAGDRVGAPVYLGGDFGLDTHKFDMPLSGGTVGSAGYTFDSTGAAIGCTDAGDPLCAPSVRAIATSSDGATLYVGGRFTRMFSQAYTNLVALNGVTNVYANTSVAVRPWKPEPTSYVHRLAMADDGTVYLGGDFTGVRDASQDALLPREGLAVVAASISTAADDAELDAWDPLASGGIAGSDAGSVTALAVSDAGVYAGGSFTSIGAQRHENVAALDAAGRAIADWVAWADAPVHALAAGNERLYLGGLFTAANGQQRVRLAAVSAAGSGDLDTAFDPAVDPSCIGAGCSSGVLSLAVTDASLYVGGSFESLAGAPRVNAGAVDPASGAAQAWRPDPDDNVYSLVATCGTVYAGGAFDRAGGKDRSRIAALDPASGLAGAWNPNANGGAVYALARDEDLVYVGGSFAKIGGTERKRLAALSAVTGAATAWNPGLPGVGDVVRALAVPSSGAVVYVGGRFTEVGGAARTNLAALERGDGDATAWNPPADGPVHALAADSESLAVGGSFRQLGPFPQQGFGSFGLGTAIDGGAVNCEAPVVTPPPEPVAEDPPPPPAPPADPPPPPAPRPVEPPPDTTPPRIEGLRLTNRSFRAARRNKRGARVGTTFEYKLSEPALVRFAFKRKQRIRCGSRKWRRHCRRWPDTNKRMHCRFYESGQRCHRWRKSGAMRNASQALEVSIPFNGKVGQRWLRPGKYRVVLRATDFAGNRSDRVKRTFKVVRR